MYQNRIVRLYKKINMGQGAAVAGGRGQAGAISCRLCACVVEVPRFDDKMLMDLRLR